MTEDAEISHRRNRMVADYTQMQHNLTMEKVQKADAKACSYCQAGNHGGCLGPDSVIGCKCPHGSHKLAMPEVQAEDRPWD